MNFILFDDQSRGNLLPLTFTRPVADIRIGIITIREKWEFFLKSKTSSLTETYLCKKFPIVKNDNNILINGSVLPNKEIAGQVKKLQPNEALVSQDTIIALHVKAEDLDENSEMDIGNISEIETETDFIKINDLWEIFSFNKDAIEVDFSMLTRNRKSEEVSKSNRILGKGKIFIEKGAKVECAVLNTENGPIYIGKNSEIHEGSLIRGPFVLCNNAVIKMGAKIYGPTTIGPFSKIGGEVNSSVILGYSNKAHDGFLGHSVIGEWCNIGADSNTSNLKNSYEKVRLWNYPQKTFIDTNLQFCGLIMGDHSKCGINTMFNTGTVVGVSTNIYGSGFQRNFIPSFSWGGTTGFKEYKISKAFAAAEAMFSRRKKV
ncbi:MAG: GlmU family protein, partial [Desulfobacula sp.]|nr:GlmU family protein [Desulfobacula sp.]